MIGLGIGINYSRVLASIDTQAQAFITAAGITDPTQITAINNLVVGLKSASLWDKMKVIYPMVGGSATSHKFNLINPLDTDAAFRVVFAGGWTHDANGAKGNGTNATADTFFVPNAQYADEKMSFGRYNDSYTTGIVLAGNGNDSYDGTNFLSGFISIGNGSGVGGFTKQSNGFVSINRPNTTQIKYYREGSIDTITQAFINKTTNSFQLCSYAGTTFSNARLKFVFFSTLLSDAENDTLKAINLTFQTTLGRQN